MKIKLMLMTWLLAIGVSHANGQALSLGMRWNKAIAQFDPKDAVQDYFAGSDASYTNQKWNGLKGRYYLYKDTDERIVRYEFSSDGQSDSQTWKTVVAKQIRRLGHPTGHNRSNDSLDLFYEWNNLKSRYSLSMISGDVLFEVRTQQDWQNEQLYGSTRRTSSNRVITDTVMVNGYTGYRTRIVNQTNLKPPILNPSPVLRIGMSWDSVKLLLSSAEPFSTQVDSQWNAAYDEAKWNGYLGYYFLAKDSSNHLARFDFKFHAKVPSSLWRKLVITQTKFLGKPKHHQHKRLEFEYYAWNSAGIHSSLMNMVGSVTFSACASKDCPDSSGW